MHVRHVTWSRPNKDIPWSWQTIPTLFDEYQAYVNTLYYGGGLVSITEFVETDTTRTYSMIWENEAAWQTYMDNPIVVAFTAAQEPHRSENGVTISVVVENT